MTIPAKTEAAAAEVTAAGPGWHLDGAMLTDVGRVRTNNEDRLAYVIPRPGDPREAKGALVVLADGMGGHAAGEVASALAVETILDAYYHGGDAAPRALAAAFAAANEAIHGRAQADPACGDMGTTCTAMVVREGGLFLAHIGDSRAYLLRGGTTLTQLTTDHSLVRELFVRGVLTAQEMATHPDRNVIVKALGIAATAEPDVWERPMPLEEGDVLLVCSDGLSDMVDDVGILAGLAGRSPADACAALRDAALAAGGRDNVSLGVFALSREAPAAALARITRPIPLPGTPTP